MVGIHNEGEVMFGRSLAAASVGAWTFFAAAMTPVQAIAADIKLLGGTSMRALLPEQLPQFEKSSGHKVTIEYGTLGAITDRISKGEAADVAIVTGEQNEKLQKEGKLLAGSRIEFAKAGYSALVKTGAARPDLGTVDAFKRTMQAAKSIALGDPAGGGPLGMYSAGLMQRLGLADDLKSKTKLFPSGTQVAEAVAKGETDIGIGLASDAVIVPGVVAISLPTEIQTYTTYTLGIVAGSKQVDAAKALIAFLTSPAAKQALAAKGFEPQ
jgi:molybdate transport system substrate-binding protein